MQQDQFPHMFDESWAILNRRPSALSACCITPQRVTGIATVGQSHRFLLPGGRFLKTRNESNTYVKRCVFRSNNYFKSNVLIWSMHYCKPCLKQ